MCHESLTSYFALVVLYAVCIYPKWISYKDIALVCVIRVVGIGFSVAHLASGTVLFVCGCRGVTYVSRAVRYHCVV